MEQLQNLYFNIAFVHIRIKDSFYIQKVYLSQSLSKNYILVLRKELGV